MNLLGNLQCHELCSSASAMKNTPLKLSYVYQCIGCDSFHLQCLGRTVTKVCSSGYICLKFPPVKKEDAGFEFHLGLARHLNITKVLFSKKHQTCFEFFFNVLALPFFFFF